MLFLTCKFSNISNIYIYIVVKYIYKKIILLILMDIYFVISAKHLLNPMFSIFFQTNENIILESCVYI